MDASKLTDYQLYEIIQNRKLHTDIKRIATEEFSKRQISHYQLNEIIKRHDQQFRPSNEGIALKYKLLLIAFPFMFPVHGIIVARFIRIEERRKRKEYWFYVCVGFVCWTIIAILFSRYSFFKPVPHVRY